MGKSMEEPACIDVGIEITEPNETLGTASIQLYYITDFKFNNSVIAITFPERPELSCDVGEFYNYSVFSNYSSFCNESTNIWNQYGRYQIHQIMVDFNSVPIEEEIKLTKANLLWNNGKHTVVDIGTVTLYHDNLDQTLLESTYSSTDSDGISVVGLVAKEDITIESIESPLLSYIEGKCTFAINGNPYQISELNNLNLDFKKGDYIEITINMQSLRAEKCNPYYNMDIQPRVVYNDKNGKQGCVRLHGVKNSLESKLTSEKEIYQYIKDREKE